MRQSQCHTSKSNKPKWKSDKTAVTKGTDYKSQRTVIKWTHNKMTIRKMIAINQARKQRRSKFVEVSGVICRKWLKTFGSFPHGTGALLGRPALLSTCFHRKPSCCRISFLIKRWRSARFQYLFASFWENSQNRWHRNENHNHFSQDKLSSCPNCSVWLLYNYRRAQSKSTIIMCCSLDTGPMLCFFSISGTLQGKGV